MMKNKKIKDRYIKLIEIINKHNLLYHTYDSPEITDDEFDDLYKKSLDIPELSKRIPLYEMMDSIVINQAAIIPLYYDNVIRFSHNRVKGLSSNAMNLLDLKRVKIIN